MFCRPTERQQGVPAGTQSAAAKVKLYLLEPFSTEPILYNGTISGTSY